MADAQLDPERILELGTGYCTSKTLLSAVELDLFTHLGGDKLSGEEIGRRLELHPRAIYDFLDALVAMRILEREGEGHDGRYYNSAEAAAFLEERSPTYIGGFLKMCNARLYRFWADLTEALKTGKPQNEVKYTGKQMFEELYSEPARLEQFMHAMAGISAGPLNAFAEQFDFSQYQSVCDVGGATGQLCTFIARRHPDLRCTTYDLPVVAPIAEKSIAAAGLGDRISVASGDFLAEPLPRPDVVVMSWILHDWNLDGKKHLIKAAYDALPDRSVRRHRELHRRRPPRQRVRPDGLADHADRVW